MASRRTTSVTRPSTTSATSRRVEFVPRSTAPTRMEGRLACCCGDRDEREPMTRAAEAGHPRRRTRLSRGGPRVRIGPAVDRLCRSEERSRCGRQSAGARGRGPADAFATPRAGRRRRPRTAGLGRDREAARRRGGGARRDRAGGGADLPHAARPAAAGDHDPPSRPRRGRGAPLHRPVVRPRSARGAHLRQRGRAAVVPPDARDGDGLPRPDLEGQAGADLVGGHVLRRGPRPWRLRDGRRLVPRDRPDPCRRSPGRRPARVPAHPLGHRARDQERGRPARHHRVRRWPERTGLGRRRAGDRAAERAGSCPSGAASTTSASTRPTRARTRTTSTTSTSTRSTRTRTATSSSRPATRGVSTRSTGVRDR